MNVNPLALLVIALAVVIGVLFFHSWLWGLFIGLLIVLVSEFAPKARL